MNKSSLNSKVQQVLNEFETLEDLQPSSDWSNSLTDKLSSVKPHTTSGFTAAKITVITLLIVLVNIGFLLSTLFNDSQKSLCRNKDLQVISKEFLINPTSLNN